MGSEMVAVELVAVTTLLKLVQSAGAKLVVDWIRYIWFVIVLHLNMSELPDCIVVWIIGATGAVTTRFTFPLLT